MDCKGNDIGNFGPAANLNACKNICLNHTGCVGLTYWGNGDCWCKNATKKCVCNFGATTMSWVPLSKKLIIYVTYSIIFNFCSHKITFFQKLLLTLLFPV